MFICSVGGETLWQTWAWRVQFSDSKVVNFATLITSGMRAGWFLLTWMAFLTRPFNSASVLVMLVKKWHYFVSVLFNDDEDIAFITWVCWATVSYFFITTRCCMYFWRKRRRQWPHMWYIKMILSKKQIVVFHVKLVGGPHVKIYN